MNGKVKTTVNIIIMGFLISFFSICCFYLYKTPSPTIVSDNISVPEVSDHDASIEETTGIDFSEWTQFKVGGMSRIFTITHDGHSLFKSVTFMRYYSEITVSETVMHNPTCPHEVCTALREVSQLK